MNVASTRTSNKIKIDSEDTINAIQKINKNKAIGIDNLTFKPIDKNELVKICIRGMDYHESRKEKKQKISKKQWGSNILNCVGNNIAKYLNHCLTVKDELMHKHGHIR